MRDYKAELEKRVAWIQALLAESGAKGIVYGNSGGKDSALAGILCRKACDNVLGIIMPCGSKQNYNSDREDALAVAKAFDIPVTQVDLTATRDALLAALGEAEGVDAIADMAKANINPRLRMATVYAVAQTRGALVCGTGNKDEAYMGYFTKWGDGACDHRDLHSFPTRRSSDLRRFDRHGNLRIPAVSGRAGQHHREGPVGRPVRGADRREGDGGHLRRH